MCYCAFWPNLAGSVPLIDDRSGFVISALGWVLIGVGAWLVVAVIVGITIGRTIRLRDRQVGEETVDRPLPGAPPGPAPDGAGPDIPVQKSEERGPRRN